MTPARLPMTYVLLCWHDVCQTAPADYSWHSPFLCPALYENNFYFSKPCITGCYCS